MIDKEDIVFNSVAAALRKKFKGIHVVGEAIVTTPPRFPAVSLVMEENSVNKSYSTFDNNENVVREGYKIEIYSNLISKKHKQLKDIAIEVDRIMDSLGYTRTFNEPIPNIDITIARRVLRYKKSNVI